MKLLMPHRPAWLKTAVVTTACLLMSAAFSVNAQILAQTLAQRVALRHLVSAARSNTPRPRATQTTEAADSSLSSPSGVAYDSSGNLYIADTGDHTVLEVSPLGIITTVAGDGEQGFGGDGGPATSAMLDSPQGVAVDAAGNLYIADTHNQRIRKVVSGTITSIAGTGTAGFSGDGGAAVSATLDFPTSLAVDTAGSVYVADTDNHRIRKISGATIVTIAGDGDQIYSGDGGAATQAGLDSPYGVAVDTAGNLYIGDTHNQRVRMVAAGSGTISTVAGSGVDGFSGDGGAGVSASLARPRGVAVSSTGNLYIADSDNHRVRGLDPGGTIATLAGDGEQGFAGDTGPATAAIFDTPRSVAVDAAGSVAIADTGNQRVRELRARNSETLAGVGDPGSVALLLSAPASVAVGGGTLTAVLSNAVAGSAGTITFLDVTNGPTTFGTAPLANGSGTYSLAAAAPGTHLFAARYQGPGSAPAVTSGVIGVVVASGDFTISAAPSSASVSSGDAASFTITLVSAGSNFGSAIALTASGLPAGASATFNPALIAAGSPQTATSVLTIQTATQTARQDGPRRRAILPLYMGFFCLPLCLNGRLRKRFGMGGSKAGLLMACFLLCVALPLSGCGSGLNPNAHPPTMFTVTITGTSAAVGAAPSISHSTTVSITVE
jgi:sugar lactone lactonase YvrE